MNKINKRDALSNARYAYLFLEKPELKLSQKMLIAKYIFLLGLNEDVIEKLDLEKRIVAYKNDSLTTGILYNIIDAYSDSDNKKTFTLIKEESKRLKEQIKAYQSGKVANYTYEEMKSLADGKAKEEYMEKVYDIYFPDRKDNKPENIKVIKKY